MLPEGGAPGSKTLKNVRDATSLWSITHASIRVYPYCTSTQRPGTTAVTEASYIAEQLTAGR